MLPRLTVKLCALILTFILIHPTINAQSDANQWTWIGGDSSNTSLLTDQLGQWGTKGIASSSHYPSARTRAVNWTDAQGNYWLFGGRGFDGVGNNGLLNDLWKYNPTTKEWTWVSGDNAVNAIGVYSGAVKPGARQGAVGWTDAYGNLWLFSGNGYASYPANATITPGVLNDVWRFNVATSQWSFIRGGTIINPSGSPAAREGAVKWETNDGKFWMMGGLTQNGRINDLWNYNPSNNTWSYVKGCTCFDQRGEYGALGVSSFSNVPGARQDAMSFTDNAGDLWLFGGQGRDSANNTGFLNDLWKYNINTNEWTWFSGSKRISQGGVYGIKGIAALSNTPGARSGSDSWTDASGKLYLYGGSGSSSFSDVWVYDPLTGLWTWKAGTSSGSPAAVHGTRQVSNINNLPGGTTGAMAWKGSGGKIFIFGGASLNNRRVNLLSNTLWEFDHNNDTWTWVNGTGGMITAPQYGTRGVASANNHPGARRLAATWKDKDGNFWLFGGLGFADSLSGGNLNDLWKYNSSAKTWTWVAGSSKVNQTSVYGTRGVASPNNIPGGRYATAGWVDTSGNIWIFGGTQGSALFNDLWQYSPKTDRWVWVRGTNGANSSSGVYGTRGIASSSNTPSGKEGTAYGVDKDGNLWLFGGRGISLTNELGLMNDLWRFTPSVGQWTWMGGSGTRNAPPFYGTQGVAGSGIPGGRQFPGVTFDSNGNCYIFGGDGIDELGTQGSLNDLWKYNIESGQWIWLKGNTTRNVLSVAGTQGVAEKNNNPGGRSGTAFWTDGLGTLWMFGGNGLGATTGTDLLQDLWKYDPATNNWTWMKGANTTFPSYQFGQKNIASDNNQPLARNAASFWYGNDGGLYFMGGLGRFNNTNTQLNYNDLWKYQLPCAVKADFRVQNVIQCVSGNAFEFTNTTTSVGAPVQFEWKTEDGNTVSTTNFNYNFLNEGSYSVKLIARLGTCVDSITRQVQVLRTPAQITVSGNTSICSGQSVILKANSGINYAYAWEKDGQLINQANDSLLNVNEAGSYKVTVTNTLNGCSSVSDEMLITVKTRPDAPTGTDNQTFCNKATIADLSATGSNLQWYDAITGGNLLPVNTDLENAKTYCATQIENGCESENRLAVTVTINKTEAPIGADAQSFCNAAKISDLSVTGTDLKWYDASTGGNILNNSSDLQSAGKYYATQTINNCESADRLAVSVTINKTAAPTGSSAQSFCNKAKIADLSANGTDLKWYDAATAGNIINSTTDLQNGVTYFATQILNNCESENRLSVAVTINNTPEPTGTAVQAFCNSAKISDINANGVDLKWYDAATGGNLFSSNIDLQNGVNYYASQTVNNCESEKRFSVAVTINITPTPTGSPAQSFCNSAKIANLSASGADLKWYDAATGGILLSANSPLQSGQSYYASQTQNNCESPQRLAVAVTVSTISAPSGNANQSFCKSATIGELSVTGTSIKWYDAATSGNMLSVNSNLQTGQSYYASQTQNNCESADRLVVTAVINAVPPIPSGNSSQSFCGAATINDLVVTGINIKWYDAVTGGNLLSISSPLQTGKSYYASQTQNNCESADRRPVSVLITPKPVRPLIFINGYDLISSSTIGNQWYSSGILIPGANLQTYRPSQAGTYMVKVVENNCESDFSEMVNFVSGGGDYVRVYPNPATDFIQVNWSIRSATNLNVAIVNANGYQVAALSNLSSGTKIPVSQLSAGLYLLYLTTPDGRQEYVVKVLKK